MSIIPGQHGRTAEIEDGRLARNLHVRADGRDPVALNQHDLIGGERRGLAVEQPPGADGGHARGLRAGI